MRALWRSADVLRSLAGSLLPEESSDIEELVMVGVGTAGSASFPGLPLLSDFPVRLDSKSYFNAASSIYSCRLSLRKALQSVPPCPSNTPK